MIRRAFFAFNALCALGLAGAIALKLGPAIEGSLAPVRSEQRIEDIQRSLDRICWTWSSVKLRPLVSDNMDAFLETKRDRYVVAIWERDTGEPWARSRAVGLGPHRQPYCVTMPPSVHPDDPVRITQMAYYPGWLGLWHLPVRLPEVVDPAGAEVP